MCQQWLLEGLIQVIVDYFLQRIDMEVKGFSLRNGLAHGVGGVSPDHLGALFGNLS
jgi:hypothetical protein